MITPVSCISCSIFDPLSMWDISKISTGIPTAWRTASMNPTNRSPRSLLSTGRSRPPFSVAAFHKFSFLFFQYIIFYLLLPPIYPEFLIKPITAGQCNLHISQPLHMDYQNMAVCPDQEAIISSSLNQAAMIRKTDKSRAW